MYKYHRYYVNLDEGIIPQKEFINVFGSLIELYKRNTLISNREVIITEGESPRAMKL